MQIMQIAELDKKREKIVLEDGSSFPFYKGERRQYGLEEGKELSPEEMQKIGRILTKRARKRTMHLLERMDRTEFQLREKLKQGYYPQDVIEDAVAYVKSYHYLDDLRYAKNYVRSRKDKKGRRRLQAELLGKGIGKELILQALEEECPAEGDRALILKWMEKKNYSPETADLKEKQKIYQFLLRKGFRSDDILHMLTAVTDYLT